MGSLVFDEFSLSFFFRLCFGVTPFTPPPFLLLNEHFALYSQLSTAMEP